MNKTTFGELAVGDKFYCPFDKIKTLLVKTNQKSSWENYGNIRLLSELGQPGFDYLMENDMVVIRVD